MIGYAPIGHISVHEALERLMRRHPMSEIPDAGSDTSSQHAQSRSEACEAHAHKLLRRAVLERQLTAVVETPNGLAAIEPEVIERVIVPRRQHLAPESNEPEPVLTFPRRLHDLARRLSPASQGRYAAIDDKPLFFEETAFDHWLSIAPKAKGTPGRPSKRNDVLEIIRDMTDHGEIAGKITQNNIYAVQTSYKIKYCKDVSETTIRRVYKII